jgi:hypothetical protein
MRNLLAAQLRHSDEFSDCRLDRNRVVDLSTGTLTVVPKFLHTRCLYHHFGSSRSVIRINHETHVYRNWLRPDPLNQFMPLGPRDIIPAITSLNYEVSLAVRGHQLCDMLGRHHGSKPQADARGLHRSTGPLASAGRVHQCARSMIALAQHGSQLAGVSSDHVVCLSA